MSDVTVAAPSAPSAPPSAPAPAAPAQNELAINTNPTSSPQPIGAQTGERPTPPPDPTKGRRDSLQKAFDKATKQQDEGSQRQSLRREPKQEAKAPAAEAKAGHNQPPEETPRERFRENGRFARDPKSTGNAPGSPQGNPQPGQAADQSRAPAGPGVQPGQPGQEKYAAQPQQPYRLLPENAPFREPLKRMSEASKHAWVDTPEPVRAAVHKMAQEFSKAYQTQKADVEAFKPLKRFHEYARSQGTTLEAALGNYLSMENMLRTDLIGGFAKITDNLARELGWKNSEGSFVNLRDIAAHILSMSPEQHQMVATRNAQAAQGSELGALIQRLEGLESSVNKMYTAQRYDQTRSAVDQFAADHPRIDELGKVVAQEIGFGFPLEEAYRRAEALYPPTQAPQTRTTTAQTRTEDRSISGAPSGGSPNAGRSTNRSSDGQPRSRRDALQNAIRRVQGGI